jgi:hypothetical protein
MSDTSPTKPGFARFRKIATFALFGAVALALCVGLAVWHSRSEQRRAWAEIQKRLDALRAAGEPVTAEDLAKLYPDPPPERDAALLLAPATAAFRKTGFTMKLPFFDSLELPPRTQALPEQLRTNIEAILNDNQTALDAIPWAKITNLWIRPSLSLGFSNMLVELPTMLCLKAIFEADAGQGPKASESLRRALALFRTFQPANPLHLRVRRQGEALVCAALEWVVNRTEIRPEDLTDFEHLLSDDHPEGLREALLTLRCQDIKEMNRFRADPINTEFPPSFYATTTGDWVKFHMLGTLRLISGRIYSDADFSEMLDARSEEIAALKLPFKQCFAEFERIRDAACEGGHATAASAGNGAALYMISRVRFDAEARAKMQVTRVALEVERWRLAHAGRAPDSLADLVPEFAPSVPLDPFDNHPLRYKKLPRGFLVYSIGADFTDDGGKEKTVAAEVNGEHYDITFSVER